MCVFSGLMLAVCRQQALASVSLSQNSKDKLWSQSVNSSLVHSLMTSQSPSIYSHAHTRAHTHASAPKHPHQSPGVSWSKCVLASRAQQGQVKKGKREKQAQQLFCLCITFLQHFGIPPHSFSSFHYPHWDLEITRQ